ncbi:TetR/AcrR family transcriptional regulator [Levilactobacillus wangkuiensis]|uniref:TetR/AcrR family transcriptional regulator n=1 Tax=Levilactobacillus wangkuiensis TaxID=2799566 RepID=UPI00194F8AB7|nr:TetR/AcrR family transcriptional regulator [Levilactobacillus wangkuiensis]
MTKLPYHRENLAAAIQQRARQQLETAGAEQLSLRQIARFLAVTPAAVYRHFPDKASLLAALRTEIMAEITATLRENVLDSADATAMLQRMVSNLLAYADQHPQAVTFALTAPLPTPVSLTTVLTLYAAQKGQATVAPQMGQAVWTFLVGVLVQYPQDQVTTDWVVTMIAHLL